MDTKIIDEAIDKYVNERMIKGKTIAIEHFLAFSYIKNQGTEIKEFMQKVKGLARYYIDYLNVMQNPLKGPELAWLGSMICIAAYAIYLMTSEDSVSLGIWLFVGTAVNAVSLVTFTARKWCKLNVTIAIYSEIVQLIDQELEKMA
jgi:hypothetical protein